MPPNTLGKDVVDLYNKLVETALVSQSNFVADSAINQKSDVFLWHQRLGYASMLKLKYVPCVPQMNGKLDCCLTCPLAKFTKIPYFMSQS